VTYASGGSGQNRWRWAILTAMVSWTSPWESHGSGAVACCSQRVGRIRASRELCFRRIGPGFSGGKGISMVMASPTFAVTNHGGSVGSSLGTAAARSVPLLRTHLRSDSYSAAVGDFNGDGKLDVAVANLGSNTVSGLLNTGSGALAAASYPSGSSGRFRGGRDFNGGWQPDLAGQATQATP